MSKQKISADVKITAVNLYLQGKKSQRQIASLYGVMQASFQRWIRNYLSMGAAAFTHVEYKRYSKELKPHAVQDYLTGQGSLNDICKNMEFV